MSCKAIVTFFGPNGKTAGVGVEMFLPQFLDWMPIEVKTFWFLERGFGEPKAIQLLMTSQGEQQLVQIHNPLQQLRHTELKEIENGLESKVSSYIDRHRISRVPRNQ